MRMLPFARTSRQHSIGKQFYALFVISHHRKMASSTCSLSSPSEKPVFSSNTDQEQATEDLKSLLRSEGGVGRWNLIDSGKGVERSFKFKTFKKTWVRIHHELSPTNRTDHLQGVHEPCSIRVFSPKASSRMVKRLQHHIHSLDNAFSIRSIS